MNFIFNTFLLIFLVQSFYSKALALTDYQINEICQRKRNKSICIKNLRTKKSDLLKGNRIEIPVVPYKKK